MARLELAAAAGAVALAAAVGAGVVMWQRGTDGEAGDARAPIATSQSGADAARDGVEPALAALALDLRAEQLASIDAPEGRWALAEPAEAAYRVLPACAPDFCLAEYGEMLLLDAAGRIARAYPMPGAKPSWIYLADDAVYGGRLGDGGLPNSTLVRIDRATLEATVVVFPHPDTAGVNWPPTWRVADPAQAAGFGALVGLAPDGMQGAAAVSHIGAVVVDPDGLREFFAALA